MAELGKLFWDYAKAYYVRPDGTPTNTTDSVKQAVLTTRKLYGFMPAVDFGPLALDFARWIVHHCPDSYAPFFGCYKYRELLALERQVRRRRVDSLRHDGESLEQRMRRIWGDEEYEERFNNWLKRSAESH